VKSCSVYFLKVRKCVKEAHLKKTSKLKASNLEYIVSKFIKYPCHVYDKAAGVPVETTKQFNLNKEPYALEAERAVLAAILFDTDNYKEAGYILFPELFYNRSHQVIYSSMQKFIECGKGVEVNPISLKEHLLKDGQLEACGGGVYLKQLEKLAQLPLNIESDAKTLYTKYLFREYLSVYGELILKFDDGHDIIKHIENAERKIHKIIVTIQLTSDLPVFRVKSAHLQ